MAKNKMPQNIIGEEKQQLMPEEKDEEANRQVKVEEKIVAEPQNQVSCLNLLKYV